MTGLTIAIIANIAAVILLAICLIGMLCTASKLCSVRQEMCQSHIDCLVRVQGHLNDLAAKLRGSAKC